ncbi:cell filamentation protein Fic [Phytoactinopolyspora endophytica]|uniref:cell filamentation protein Fic n=1 Tax=Phytoactinopolyspora endophytica TaxID=1642495 RepID=UPI00101C23E1|nr:cell filamentation protein Fic [Phytoactinopolyspora endophytica]
MDAGQIFDAVGFRWDRSTIPTDVPAYSVQRAVFRFYKALAEFIWDASVLEGNPFTYPEVQTLLDGITVGGHKLSDERQVLNLADSAKELRELVIGGSFTLDKATSDYLHAIVARDEAFDAGFFRGEGEEQRLTPGVALGEYGRYLPPETEPGGENLRRIHAAGLVALTDGIESVFEQALVYFLFGALQQFYFDGNKRTARYMMNGHLMSHGIDAISIPAARAREFNARMVDFYRHKDASVMIAFLTDCHPDADELVTTEMRRFLE